MGKGMREFKQSVTGKDEESQLDEAQEPPEITATRRRGRGRAARRRRRQAARQLEATSESPGGAARGSGDRDGGAMHRLTLRPDEPWDEVERRRARPVVRAHPFGADVLGSLAARAAARLAQEARCTCTTAVEEMFFVLAR